MPKQIFLLEDRDRTAIFVPLKGLILEIKNNEKDRVRQLINRPDFSLNNLFNLFPELDQSRLYKKFREANRQEEEFCPDVLVLFTTLDCNLRCIYCYSKAGEQKLNMVWQTAKTAIDFVIKNAKSKGSEESTLEFHGGGEPTWNWSLFQMALDYFRKQAQQNGIAPKINLATNGMLSENQIEWITSRISSVQVSLDGVKEIQDFQRPTSRGGMSFEVVCNTIESFLSKGNQLIIHCTVTEKGIGRIPEIVQFLTEKFRKITIHLEPVCECGRSLQMGQKFPSPELFIQGFIASEKIVEKLGVQLSYSGSSSNLTEFRQGFCGVSSPNFIVTPTGLVSACHEVAEKSHPLAEYFIYGHLDFQKNDFVFDYDKIQKLRKSTKRFSHDCKECFAQHYCAGECFIKNLSSNGKVNLRCKINKELTKHYVFKNLFRKEDNDAKTDGHGKFENERVANESCLQ